jgi:hypothetical protein
MSLQNHDEEPTMLLAILIMLLVFSLLGGGWGFERFGYGNLTPAGLIIFLLFILWLAGQFRFF